MWPRRRGPLSPAIDIDSPRPAPAGARWGRPSRTAPGAESLLDTGPLPVAAVYSCRRSGTVTAIRSSSRREGFIVGFRGLFEGWHLVVLLVVLVLLFGAKRLPDASRAVGRSLKIFKSEIKDLTGDDDEKPAVESGTSRRDSDTGESARPVPTASTQTAGAEAASAAPVADRQPAETNRA